MSGGTEGAGTGSPARVCGDIVAGAVVDAIRRVPVDVSLMGNIPHTDGAATSPVCARVTIWAVRPERDLRAGTAR